ncbi:MAG: hypothetical protein MZV65_35645 [Chromatiales bacterium]|nr:hypothetical protein [Chromatiales bacterium]
MPCPPTEPPFSERAERPEGREQAFLAEIPDLRDGDGDGVPDPDDVCPRPPRSRPRRTAAESARGRLPTASATHAGVGTSRATDG